MLAITDASAGADPLGYVISVTNDVVTVRSEPDGAERDYNTAFLQPGSRTLARFPIRLDNEWRGTSRVHSSSTALGRR